MSDTLDNSPLSETYDWSFPSMQDTISTKHGKGRLSDSLEQKRAVSLKKSFENDPINPVQGILEDGMLALLNNSDPTEKLDAQMKKKDSERPPEVTPKTPQKSCLMKEAPSLHRSRCLPRASPGLNKIINYNVRKEEDLMFPGKTLTLKPIKHPTVDLSPRKFNLGTRARIPRTPKPQLDRITQILGKSKRKIHRRSILSGERLPRLAAQGPGVKYFSSQRDLFSRSHYPQDSGSGQEADSQLAVENSEKTHNEPPIESSMDPDEHPEVLYERIRMQNPFGDPQGRRGRGPQRPPPIQTNFGGEITRQNMSMELPMRNPVAYGLSANYGPDINTMPFNQGMQIHPGPVWGNHYGYSHAHPGSQYYSSPQGIPYATLSPYENFQTHEHHDNRMTRFPGGAYRGVPTHFHEELRRPVEYYERQGPVHRSDILNYEGSIPFGQFANHAQPSPRRLNLAGEDGDRFTPSPHIHRERSIRASNPRFSIRNAPRESQDTQFNYGTAAQSGLGNDALPRRSPGIPFTPPKSRYIPYSLSTAAYRKQDETGGRMFGSQNAQSEQKRADLHDKQTSQVDHNERAGTRAQLGETSDTPPFFCGHPLSRSSMVRLKDAPTFQDREKQVQDPAGRDEETNARNEAAAQFQELTETEELDVKETLLHAQTVYDDCTPKFDSYVQFRRPEKAETPIKYESPHTKFSTGSPPQSRGRLSARGGHIPCGRGKRQNKESSAAVTQTDPQQNAGFISQDIKIFDLTENQTNCTLDSSRAESSHVETSNTPCFEQAGRSLRGNEVEASRETGHSDTLGSELRGRVAASDTERVRTDDGKGPIVRFDNGTIVIGYPEGADPLTWCGGLGAGDLGFTIHHALGNEDCSADRTEANASGNTAKDAADSSDELSPLTRHRIAIANTTEHSSTSRNITAEVARASAHSNKSTQSHTSTKKDDGKGKTERIWDEEEEYAGIEAAAMAHVGSPVPLIGHENGTSTQGLAEPLSATLLVPPPLTITSTRRAELEKYDEEEQEMRRSIGLARGQSYAERSSSPVKGSSSDALAAFRFNSPSCSRSPNKAVSSSVSGRPNPYSDSRVVSRGTFGVANLDLFEDEDDDPTARPEVSPKVKLPNPPRKQMFGEKGFLDRGAASAHMAGQAPKPTKSNFFKGIGGIAAKMKKAANSTKDEFVQIMGTVVHSAKAGIGSPEKKTVISNFPISLEYGTQMQLFGELNLLLTTVINDYFMLMKQEGRISPASVRSVNELWASGNRAQVIEFRYDLKHQMELSRLNMDTIRYFGSGKNRWMRQSAMYIAWSDIGREMGVRSFCSADFAIKKMLSDSRILLELMGAKLAQWLLLQKLQCSAYRIIEAAEEERKARAGIQYGVTRPVAVPDTLTAEQAQVVRMLTNPSGPQFHGADNDVPHHGF